MPSSAIYELPRRLALLLTTVGPLQTTSRNGRHTAIHAIIEEPRALVGFLLIEQLTRPSTPLGPGLVTAIPEAAHPAAPAGGESTYVFAATLQDALDYANRVPA